MHDGHVLSRAASVWVRRKSTLAVAIGGLLALLLWTIPNWQTFWQHASQFPVLWQTPANRQSIVSLVIKILSPLFIMGMITLALWIFSLVKTEVEKEEQYPIANQFFSSPGRGGTSRTLAITSSNFSQLPRLARTAAVSRVRQAETWYASAMLTS